MTRKVLLKLNQVLSRMIAAEQAQPPRATEARGETFSRIEDLDKDLRRQGIMFNDEPNHTGVKR